MPRETLTQPLARMTATTHSERTETARSEPDWFEIFDAKSQLMYYFNRATGQTQWEKPTTFQPAAFLVVPTSGQDSQGGASQQQFQNQHHFQSRSQVEYGEHRYPGQEFHTSHLNLQQQQQEFYFQQQLFFEQQHQQQYYQYSQHQIDQYGNYFQQHSHQQDLKQPQQQQTSKFQQDFGSSSAAKSSTVASSAGANGQSKFVQQEQMPNVAQNRSSTASSKPGANGLGEKRPSLRWQMDQIKETEPLRTKPSEEVISGNEEEEGNTSDEDVEELYSGNSRRCWGRPNRSVTLDELDETLSTGSVQSSGRFRTISCIDQQSLLTLASYADGTTPRARSIESPTSLLKPLPGVEGTERKKETQQPVGGEGQFQFQQRTRANTTNSIYVTSTMTDPDASEELASVSGVIHAHMVQFLLAPPHAQLVHSRYKAFDEDLDLLHDPNLSPRQKSESPSFLDGPQLTRKPRPDSHRVPSRERILEFVKDVYQKAQMEKECLIMSFAYLERLLKATRGQLTLNHRNWKAIVLSTMILASKVWDDLSMWNADFSLICPSFTLKKINEWEICLLEAMKYEVRVSSSQYAKYYFQLRAMRKALGITSRSATPPVAGISFDRLNLSNDSSKASQRPLSTGGTNRSRSNTSFERM